MNGQYRKPLPLCYATVKEISSCRLQVRSDESDEKSARLSILPSGAAAHRIYLKGVITAVQQTERGMSAIFRDRTGRISLHASGEFNPGPYSLLKSMKDLPCFVALTGKISLFTPPQSEGKETQIIVTIIPDNLGEISKLDRYTWDFDVYQATQSRCLHERIFQYEDVAARIYGPDAQLKLLSKIEELYQEAGVGL